MKTSITAIFFIATLFAFSGNVFATYTHTPDKVQITAITVYADNEPQNPNYSGALVVSFSGGGWGVNGVCGQGSAFLEAGNNNLYSSILAAQLSAKQIQIFTKDSANKQDGICFIRAISVY